MDEAKALLRAICASPDEDTPRLVYADWLDEHGQSERAEFVRVQVELARIEGDDPRRPALARREHELWAAHERTWTAALPRGTSDPVFRRGFLAGVNASGRGAFAKYAGELFAAHPVTSVWLGGDENQLRTVARSPYLARVRDLGVFDAEPDGLGLLLRSQFATGLRGLHLDEVRLVTRRTRLIDFFSVLDVPHLTGLSRLSLKFDSTDVKESRQFARLKVLPALTELTLHADALADTTVRELVATPAVAGLRVLRLGGSRLTDAGVRHLAESTHLAELRRLTLSGAHRVTAEGFAALAEAPHLANLTDLDLRSTNVTSDDTRALIDAPNLPRLSRLVLNCTPAAGPDAQFDHGPWNACQPDHGPGVLWAAEARQAGNTRK